MEHEIFRAKRESALDLSAKSDDALLAHFLVLAAHVHQIAGVNDQRAYVVLGAQGTHTLALLGIDLGRLPHARAGGEDLEGVGADFARPLDCRGWAATRAQMNSD